MVNICHLIKFHLASTEEKKIDKNFRIRAILSEEYRRIIEIYGKSKLGIYREYNHVDFCIENKSEKQSKTFSIDVKELIMAMCLYSGKAITQGAILMYDHDDPNWFKTSMPFINSYECLGEPWIKVTNDQIQKFSKFWKDMKNIQINFKDIGIRYFRETMFAEKLEDKLIKLTIAMENILLPGDDRHELTYKFSTRAAFILADEYKKREKIKKLFNKFYSIRSCIVHGTKLSDKDKKFIHNNYEKYFLFCRKVICLFLENQNNWKKMLEDASLGENILKYNLANYIEE